MARMSSLLTNCLLAVTMTLAPVRVVAAPSVEDLYMQGQEKFDAGEFGSAAALWAEAVRTIPEDADNTQTRLTVMNLALDAYVRMARAAIARNSTRRWLCWPTTRPRSGPAARWR